MYQFFFVRPKLLVELFGTLCFIGSTPIMQLIAVQDADHVNEGLLIFDLQLWCDFLLQHCPVAIVNINPTMIDYSTSYWHTQLTQGK